MLAFLVPSLSSLIRSENGVIRRVTMSIGRIRVCDPIQSGIQTKSARHFVCWLLTWSGLRVIVERQVEHR
jgi:hypothetical protein